MPRATKSREGAPSWWDTDEWRTPDDLFEKIAWQFGPFDLDAAATKENAKAPTFYTKKDNGLEQLWFGNVWINPPYSAPGPWCKVAAHYTYIENKTDHGGSVVMLLPAAVDTEWFHMWVVPFAAWAPLRGRISFLDWNGKPKSGNRAGNVLAVYPGQGLLDVSFLEK